jgi:hypothetical protein
MNILWGLRFQIDKRRGHAVRHGDDNEIRLLITTLLEVVSRRIGVGRVRCGIPRLVPFISRPVDGLSDRPVVGPRHVVSDIEDAPVIGGRDWPVPL